MLKAQGPSILQSLEVGLRVQFHLSRSLFSPFSSERRIGWSRRWSVLVLYLSALKLWGQRSADGNIVLHLALRDSNQKPPKQKPISFFSPKITKNQIKRPVDGPNLSAMRSSSVYSFPCKQV